MKNDKRKPATELVRAGVGATPFREHSEALFLTSSFTFASAEDAAEKFAQPMADYVYSRFSNPTVTTLARKVAALEEAELALATASGMSAILSLVMGLCKAGDHVLCGASAFGATLQLLGGVFPKFGVDVELIPGAEPEEWRRAARAETVLLLAESPSNPALEIADIAALAEIAHSRGALLAVDNCFCPFGQKPLTLGADIVVHSATKYLDGQGRVLGGIIAGGEEVLRDRIYPFLRCGGPAMSPFNAWVVGKGLETLPLRIRAHSDAAMQVAEAMQKCEKMESVLHTALPSHPRHALAMRQQNGLGGGIVSLYLRGGRKEAWEFINALRLFSVTANFGDAKSTVSHPATTTHSKVEESLRAKLGISENLVRLSVGLESPEDLIGDLCGALG